MKKSYINKVSKKQTIELEKRRQLKAELIREHGEVCMTCGSKPYFPPISLSHIISLARGGKTCKENCILECGPCHSKRHGLKEAK
ncbi:MAG: HNH endonuclease [Deltaproteobacteria bacterium]|nr:HNH endonuclease [Deltaproteobacteria bacterium]